MRRAVRHHPGRVHPHLGADVADGPGEEGQRDRGAQPRAGAATFVGPLIVAVFLGLIGAGGVTIIFAGLYVVAALCVHWLTLPPESQEIVEKGLSLSDLDVETHHVIDHHDNNTTVTGDASR